MSAFRKAKIAPIIITEIIVQARNRNPNLNFLVRIFSGGVGGLPREGVGAEKFGMSLETREIKLFWWDIPGFCRDIPEVPEKFEKKKVCVQLSSPNNCPGNELKLQMQISL